MERKFQAINGYIKVDSELGVFHESGIKLNFRPKELAVLSLLVENNGELVTKEQIISSAWSESSASDESIARCISVIKTRLREVSPGSELLIKTEYGRGYRFVGTVSLNIERRKRKERKSNISRPKILAEIASRAILTCEYHTTVFDAACLLQKSQTSSLIVLQKGIPVGIWTETDAMELDLAAPSIFDVQIGTVMNDVVTIEDWKPISDAVVLMRSKGIGHLLVVDKLSKIYGIVSQTDLVYCHGVESFMTVRVVKSVAYKSPLVITENLSVIEIARRMRLKHTEISIIQLTPNQIYSFTERDLIGLIAEKRLSMKIDEFSTKPLVTISEDTSLLAARQLMQIKKVRHLAVTDYEGNFLKILSLGDILTVIENSYIQLLEEILEDNNKTVSAGEAHIKMLTNAVQQTAGMVLITNQYGEIEYVNSAFENLTGYKLEEIKELNPRIFKSGASPKQLYQNLWTTVMSGKTWKGELCNKKKSGEMFWVLATISPILDDQDEIKHIVSVQEDISDRVEMEERLREIEQRFNEMADHSPVMIWESGPDGKVSFLNHIWLEFTGRKLNEQIGNGWAEQIHPEDLHSYLDIFQKALISRSSFEVDHRIKDFSGHFRWVMNTAIPRFNDQGSFLGFRGSCVDITKRKMRENEAQNLAYYDHLTGLATRSLFHDRFDQALLQAKRNNTTVAILNIDLDRFKPVNDMYGHVTGDILLQQVAERLRKCVRQSDTVCRYGGDEFLILAVHMPKQESALYLAKKILKSIEERFLIWGHEIYISCSIGVAIYPTHAETKDELMASADQAMFTAKQQGKARISF